MTSLLIRLFVKEYQKTGDSRVRERYGVLAGLTGIVSNFLLFLLKLGIGMAFKSIAVVADAVNNLSDSAASLVTVVGFRLAAKPADAEHPFGHARFEYITGLVVSLVIVILGLELMRTSVLRIIKPAATEFSWLLLAALAVSALAKIWQALFYLRIGGLIKSSALKATAADSRNDVLATGALLAGAVASRMSGFNLDGYMGVAVALFILISGIRLVIETGDPLLGSAPEQDLVQDIYAKILEYEGILGLHDLHVHSYGPGRHFVSVHCEVSAREDVMLSHDRIDNIEQDFREQLGIELVIHMDPVDVDDERTNALREQVSALVRAISPRLYIHDFRVVWGVTHSNLVFDIEAPFGFEMKEAELKKAVESGIRRLDSSYNAVMNLDYGYVPREEFQSDE